MATRIDRLRVFTATGEDGVEGIIATGVGGIWMSLVTGDPDLAERLRPIGEQACESEGKVLSEVLFARIEPGGDFEEDLKAARAFVNRYRSGIVMAPSREDLERIQRFVRRFGEFEELT